MKVYDIISESRADLGTTIANMGRRVLGMARSFETTAGKRIFDDSVQAVADEMYRVQISLGRTPTNVDVNKVLKDTLYTENSASVFSNPRSADYLTPEGLRELNQDVIAAAKKLFEKRLKDNNVNIVKPGVAGRVAKKLDLTTPSGVLNNIYKAGIFYAAAFADGSPIREYWTRWGMAQHKRDLGPDTPDPAYPDYFGGKGITQEQYNTYLAEEQFIMITNLVPYMIPFAPLSKVLMGGIIGTNMAYSGPGSSAIDAGTGMASGALAGAAATGAGWIISKITPKGWNFANKALAAAWIGYISTNPKVPFTGGLFGKNEDLTLRQTLTALALAEALDFVPNVISKLKMGLDNITDDANKYVMDWAKQKGIALTGSDKPAPSAPASAPASAPSAPAPPAPPAPQGPGSQPGQLPPEPTVFHPNEWKKQGGSWQYRGSGKRTITDYEFKELKDGDPIPSD